MILPNDSASRRIVRQEHVVVAMLAAGGCPVIEDDKAMKSAADGSTMTQSEPDGGGDKQPEPDDGDDTERPEPDDNGDDKPPDAGSPSDGGSEARNCQEILTNDPAEPSGVYTIDPDGAGPAPTLKVFCDQANLGGGWTMVFKLSSGVDGDPSGLWFGPPVNEHDETLLGTQKSAAHYVSSYIGRFWNSGGSAVTDARVAVYHDQSDAPVREWLYDAIGSDNSNWYDYPRMWYSLYDDLQPNSGMEFNATPGAIYSIVGDDASHRRFFINKLYMGCPDDYGWLVVDGVPDDCPWEGRLATVPAEPIVPAPPIRILYSSSNTSINWQHSVDDYSVGVGDVFAVFVR